ncbi:uncharacterized protein TEOVI_000178800 [Trypanosoma equiperdum]|uniref:Uncharacterized protein n=4 Tax=Trypanozoon TaxID=39700 RepID=Q383G5_TRYB2|nr:hypothetical protein, conserved [Trypanosoma brucei gambiense DAL972]XP_829178.1 hypothetical protein, conserved [Trypanosoma brucei brucei TREU927]6HIV_DX Chain DX, ms71 [Trypanosoma brucei brucei]6HIW_DX Chain DX, mS71 [Trypanosoma brucei brucei]6HIZ_DX Chain DX, mS71 [Trypanosoma brucei brucei]6SG9_DX Chain DX, mS71 [Trypanosoma brucei brucei]6SGB_DX Chain DX, mS71 [Trypanosoma brucei brucei]7PUA_DX Chain DX, mS71 [Trypanosoma brucei brucei]7PUB_DX Chain DX, mS71 [Trypanosoma brucei b|eukprot:XP_011780390.1 hypothetical protein, conserved [Trypanosoma brucei gambiense DAL972]
MFHRAFVSSSDLTGCTIALSSVCTQKRYWAKPKKRPKVGQGFHEKAQKWREEYLLDRHRALADSLRAYVEFSTSKRVEPWDARFKPFDRIEKDGVYVLMRYMMEEKLQLCNYHHRPVKRLFCNIGLMGPQITTKARWKPYRFATNPAGTSKAERMYQRDKTVYTHGHND